MCPWTCPHAAPTDEILVPPLTWFKISQCNSLILPHASYAYSYGIRMTALLNHEVFINFDTKQFVLKYKRYIKGSLATTDLRVSRAAGKWSLMIRWFFGGGFHDSSSKSNRGLDNLTNLFLLFDWKIWFSNCLLVIETLQTVRVNKDNMRGQCDVAINMLKADLPSSAIVLPSIWNAVSLSTSSGVLPDGYWRYLWHQRQRNAASRPYAELLRTSTRRWQTKDLVVFL